MAVSRRWTYAARVDLGLYLEIAATAQSFLSKWPVLPPVSRLWDFLYGGGRSHGTASVSDVSGIQTA